MASTNQRLREAAEAGDIGAFYELIPLDPYLLEKIDKKPFVDTPLHVAASAGHTHFAMEMMRLKPSFAWKPNHSGFSPLHLALQNGHSLLVRRLVQVDPDLVRVKGRMGITPLHFVAKTGDLDLLAEFLVICPKSVEDLTIQSETALHVAMKNEKYEAVEVLVGWLQRGLHEGAEELEDKVLNWKDEEGNTVLHIAASYDRPQVVISLLISGALDVNSKDSRGWTALDIIEEKQLRNRETLNKTLLVFGALRSSSLPTSLTRVDYLRSRISYFEKRLLISTMRIRLHIPSEKRSALLVVAVLMVTATYQMGINPPGGLWKDNYTPPNYLNTTTVALNTSSPPPHHVGTTVMSPADFFLFTIYNSTVLWISIAIISILFPSDFLSYVLLMPISAFLVSHIFAVHVISGGELITLFSFLGSTICIIFSATMYGLGLDLVRREKLLRHRTLPQQ